MSSVRPLNALQHDKLKELNENFAHKAKIAGCSAAAASFLLIGALIVITCGSLCLLLPGVNVVTHVILPAVVPGSLAIIASIPFMVAAVQYSEEKNEARDEMILKMIDYLDTHQVPEMDEEERVNFILKNFLNWQIDSDDSSKLAKNQNWTMEYQAKILSDIKEKIGTNKSDRNPRQESIATALDEARTKLSSKR
jgi:hypothetical protein